MIIDEILDAKEGHYDVRYFYNYVTNEESLRSLHFDEDNYPISRALDGGTNADVQRELCAYIDREGYNQDIKLFINQFTWVD